MSAAPYRALRFTLESGDEWTIDAREVRGIRAGNGFTLVDCGRMAYVVRDSVLSLKLRLDSFAASPPLATTQTARVFHA